MCIRDRGSGAPWRSRRWSRVAGRQKQGQRGDKKGARQVVPGAFWYVQNRFDQLLIRPMTKMMPMSTGATQRMRKLYALSLIHIYCSGPDPLHFTGNNRIGDGLCGLLLLSGLFHLLLKSGLRSDCSFLWRSIRRDVRGGRWEGEAGETGVHKM